MTQEEKELLLIDLSARFPYGVKIQRYGDGLDDSAPFVLRYNNTELKPIIELGWKPYLRPMSSMTDEEAKEYKQFLEDIEGYAYSIDCVPQIDWLNSHYFDYRGLIEKGLALEAPKGMYNTK